MPAFGKLEKAPPSLEAWPAGAPCPGQSVGASDLEGGRLAAPRDEVFEGMQQGGRGGPWGQSLDKGLSAGP